MLVGLQDDAMALRGNPTFTFRMLKQLRVQIVRVNLNWNEVAKRRPAHRAGSGRSRVRLGGLRPRRPLRGAERHAAADDDPVHADMGERRQGAQRAADELHDLRNFAYAAATRYSGKYIPNTDDFDEMYLPAVKHWLAWNEPNNPNWLQADVRRPLRQPALVRADLHRDLAGRPLHELRGREGRLRRHGPAREQQRRARARPSMSRRSRSCG